MERNIGHILACDGKDDGNVPTGCCRGTERVGGEMVFCKYLLCDIILFV